MMEAATDQWPEVIAQIAERHHEGPLLAAAFEHHMVHVDDLYADVPWREYQRDALEQTPIRSVLSLELFQMKTGVSILNFYADQPHAFDEESREMGLIFATHIALAWQLLRRNDEFRSALASRDIIGQAKGTIMERFDMDAVQAFDLLVRLSPESNTKLVNIAERLVLRGDAEQAQN